MLTLRKKRIHRAVRETYGKIANSSTTGCGCSGGGCCGASNSGSAADMSKALGYSSDEVTIVPEGANLGLGCGNPQSIAALKAGETVLDLGSGAGFDAFLAARRVGESGRVIGVDMTPQMIARARANAKKGDYLNVEFIEGEIEDLPLADASVDVIISNCVINLSPDKPRVFSEAYRVLRQGGRLAVSDIVAFAEIPAAARADMKLLTGCFAGASMISELESMLRAAGFKRIRIAPIGKSATFMRDWVQGMNSSDYALSAFIEAQKPYADGTVNPAEPSSTMQGEPAPASACCGGPPKAGEDACCALDAREKAEGKAGCGCGDSAGAARKAGTIRCCA